MINPTPQEIFDRVVTHLRTQNRKSYSIDGDNAKCVYRSKEGYSCAVGCLIPDELYKPEMDGFDDEASDTSIDGLIKKNFVLPDYFKDNLMLLSELQYVHDRTVTTEDLVFISDDLEYKLKRAAINCDLKYNKI